MKCIPYEIVKAMIGIKADYGEDSPVSSLPSLFSEKADHRNCLDRVINFKQRNTELVAKEQEKYASIKKQEQAQRIFEHSRMDYEDVKSKEFDDWLTATCQQTSDDLRVTRKKVAKMLRDDTQKYEELNTFCYVCQQEFFGDTTRMPTMQRSSQRKACRT